MRRVHVRGGRVRVEAHELQRSTGVLGKELDQSLGECRRDELARPEMQRALHAEASSLEGLAVDLGEQRTLVEVERTDRDGVVVRYCGRDGCARSGTTSGHREHDRHDHERQDERTTSAHSHASPGHRTAPPDSPTSHASRGSVSGTP